jgi:hypothetical protein
MVVLRAQVWHSRVPPKGCMVVRVANPRTKRARSADLQMARWSPLVRTRGVHSNRRRRKSRHIYSAEVTFSVVSQT